MNTLRVRHKAFFNQTRCFSGVHLLGKHPTVSTYHTSAFQMKNKNRTN